jgi:4-amino-4-deoxy-L-arabinose transferase-like glycosyltransferase
MLGSAVPAARSASATLSGILLLAAVLLFANLGRPRMWQDEAETALLGRNTLRFGVPRVWDGVNLVTQYYPLDFDRHLLFQKPWLPVYAVAASFALLGEGTAQARLPFAVCGLLTVYLTWRVGARLTGERSVGALAALLLTLSLPFILYARQCRWYTLAMALTLLVIEGEQRLEEPRGWLRFGLPAGLLFHVNFLTLAVTLAGLLAGRFWTRGFSRAVTPNVVRGLLVLGAAALPWMAAFPTFGFVADSASGGLGNVPRRVAWLFSDFNRYVLPLPGVIVLMATLGRDLGRTAWFRSLAAAFLVAVLLCALPLSTSLVTIIGFRYVVNLLPVGAILFAAVLREATRPRPWLLPALLAVHLGTYGLALPLSLWPPFTPAIVRPDLLQLGRAVFVPPRGPIDGAVEFLQTQARPGETLFTPYEHLPYQFYTGLRTVGIQKAGTTLDRLGLQLPEYVSTFIVGEVHWIVPRAYWDGLLGAPRIARLVRILRDEGLEVEEHVLEAPDLEWQWREYPPCNRFADDPAQPRLSVLRVTGTPRRVPRP